MKKKGLIISTVVMVVVLIASLTTATYAWFTQTAAATVEELNINTEAVKGLQIAMRATKELNVDNIYSGEVNYVDGGWTSDTPGWGSSISFSADSTVGQMTNAVTKATTATAGNYYVPVEPAPTALTTDHYCLKDGAITQCTAGQEVDSSAKYFTKDTTIAEGDYIVPIGYTSDIRPIGYTKADANKEYYSLTFALTNLVEANQIGMSIEVTPSGNAAFGAVDATKPGMTAASRISITVNKKDFTGEGKDDIAPFSQIKHLSNNTFSDATATNGYTEAKDGKQNLDGRYAFILDDKGAAANIPANNVYYITMLIWIEGTDTECSNRTTGTSMNFKINFVYSEAAALADTKEAWGLVNGTAAPEVEENLLSTAGFTAA